MGLFSIFLVWELVRRQSVYAFASLKLRRTPRFAIRSPHGCATHSPKGEAWWARQDSNLQPDRYERPALTIELQAPPTVPPRAARNGAATPYMVAGDPAMPRSGPGTFARQRALAGRIEQTGRCGMFRWAIICLVISLVAGGLGLANISAFAKKLSIIFFALFFIGFLALVGLAYLVSSAVNHTGWVPALVAVSV